MASWRSMPGSIVDRVSDPEVRVGELVNGYARRVHPEAPSRSPTAMYDVTWNTHRRRIGE